MSSIPESPFPRTLKEFDVIRGIFDLETSSALAEHLDRSLLKDLELVWEGTANSDFTL